MNQDLFDWLLLLLRWLHITVAVTWVGTSIFFMWLDRTFKPNPDATHEGHVGEVWMVHGGGFYHVEKLKMGPTKVPKELHWFKWESYWTWMSGFALVCLIFYTGGGTFLIDETIHNLPYHMGVIIGLFSIFGSWFFYDFLWERKLTRDKPIIGHILTLVWFFGMSYYLCHRLSGRAAYIHIGAMLGTWMTANVFMRIIPRQVKMVEATQKGEPVNQDWGKNAKSRSTHNTYFSLPVIFIMLSNHFPSTYGHENNWFVLFLICAAGAAIREYFVVRIDRPGRSKLFAAIGIFFLIWVVSYTKQPSPDLIEEEMKASGMFSGGAAGQKPNVDYTLAPKRTDVPHERYNIKGFITFEGKVPQGKKLRLPRACEMMHKGDVYSDEAIVKNGKVQNVLVRVLKGHEGLDFGPIPSESVKLDQRGCVYVPRVVALRVGQEIEFINSDPIFHNVKSVSKVNGKFNLAMPKQNQIIKRKFGRPEFTMQTKCSVHPWMKAYIAIFDHPFYSVSDKNGEYMLKDLPPGKYTIEAWHESFGIKTVEVELSGNKLLNFNF